MCEPPDDELARRIFLSEQPAPANLALVLGSHDAAEAGRRACRAAELFAAGYAPRLLLSGGDPVGRGESEAALMADEALRRGVPAAALLLESRSRTTVENMIRSRELLTQAGLLAEVRALLLVSSWWHLRRARALAGKVFGSGVRLICCAAECGSDPTTWARGPVGRRVLEGEQGWLRTLET